MRKRKTNTQRRLERLVAESEAQLRLQHQERMGRLAGDRKRKLQNLLGRKFGRLRVLKAIGSIKIPGRTMQRGWKCICECGQFIDCTTSMLNKGQRKSCGCLLDETKKRGARFIHGCARKGKKLSVYHVYRGMMDRCYNKNCPSYERYGGAGIGVCEKWRAGFKNFFIDMGHRPVGMSLDRINNNKGYCKENCRWATRIQQNNNTRRNVFAVFRGKRKTWSEWGRVVGLSRATITGRLALGWPIKKILTTPVMRRAIRY